MTQSQFKFMEVNEVAKAITDEQGVLWDIRDPKVFNESHPQGAINLTNDNVANLIHTTEFNTNIYVICYHGRSSQNIAQYLVNQGFKNVYSVNGGFEAWVNSHLPIS